VHFQRFLVASWAAASLALVSSPLGATEQHNLYSFNGWKVDLVVRDDGSLACVAGTLNEKDELFAVRIDPVSDVSVIVVFKNPETGVRDLNINIHGITSWELEDFETFFYGGSFTFWRHEAGRNFLEDLKKGRSLSVSATGSDQIFARFLIDGSAPALASLVDCYSLIRGQGV
jgi:hypothetical protein